METPIINIFCYSLPGDVSRKIYNEFNGRFKDVKYMVSKYDYYSNLRQHEQAIEIMLAMTIFYKRIITNLDSAIKFYGTVTKHSQTDTVKIGTYDLNDKEKRRLQAIIISFQNLIEKYNIPYSIFDYYETKDFLNTVKVFLENDSKS